MNWEQWRSSIHVGMKKVEQFIEFSNDATMKHCVSRRCGLTRLPVSWQMVSHLLK